MGYISGMFRRNLKLALADLAAAAIVLAYLDSRGTEFGGMVAAMVPFTVVMYFLVTKSLRLLSGAYGEDSAYDVLSRELDDYGIFRNVYIGAGDVDLLVVGKSGVHVVEVKRLRYPVKASRGKVKYGKANLLEQLERNESIIKQRLKERGFRAPVRGHLLVFGKVRGNNRKIVTDARQLAGRIRGRRRVSGTELERILDLFPR